MATELEQLLQDLTIQMKLEGADAITASFRSFSKSVKNGTIDLEALKKKYGDLDKAARVLAQSFKKEHEEAKKYFRTLIENTIKSTNSFLGMGDAIRDASVAFKSLIVPSSFKDSVKTTIDYDKSVLKAGASVTRLGIGLNTLESSLIKTAGVIGTTREETLKLFDQFQSGMRFTSIGDFENILKRVKDMVGSNSEAMGAYQSAIAQVSQQYPLLGKALANIDKEDKNSIQNKIRTLYFIGKIGDAEYKTLSAYVSGSQQVTAADRKRQQEAQRNIQLQQEFNRQVEKIKLTYGPAILSFLSKATGLMDKFGASSRSGATNVLYLMGTVLALGTAVKAIGFIKGIARGISPLLPGGGPGKGGSNILGGAPTPVLVTNFPPSLGGPGGGPSVIGGMSLGKKILGGGVLAVGGGAFLGASSMLQTKSEGYVKRGERDKAEFSKGLSVATNIGGSALTGAGVGMMTGGIPGAAVGAAVGLTAGLVKNFGYFSKQFKQLFDWRDKAGNKELADRAREEAPAKAALLKARNDDAKAMELQKKIENTAKANEGRSYTDVSRDLAAQRREAEKTMERIAPEVDVEAIRRVSEKTGVGIKVTGEDKDAAAAIQRNIAEQEKEISIREQVLEANRGAFSEDQIKREEEIIKKKKDIRDQTVNIVAETREGNDALREAKASLSVIAAEEERIVSLKQKQQDFAAALGDSYNAQAGYVKSLAEQMSITGNIDMGKLTDGIDEGIRRLEEEKTAQQELINMLKVGAPTEQIAGSRALTEEQRRQYNEKVKTKDLDIIAAQQASMLSNAQSQMVIKEKQITELRLTSLDPWKDSLSLARAQADQAEALVSLMDNYAVGVGASAEQRVKAFQAEENYIQTQKQQLASLRADIANEEKDGKINLRLRAQAKELETGILSAQQKQASMVKALRDGWVSAMSAMNVGADSFSEIVMNVETNTAQVLRMGGIRSGFSGAFARRGEDVGYTTSERMNQFGRISNVEGRGGMALAYRTRTDDMLPNGGIRGFEYRAREQFGVGSGDRVQEQARRTASGGLGALAMGASAIAAGPIIAGEGGGYGRGYGSPKMTAPPTITAPISQTIGSSTTASFPSGMNVTVKFDNIKQFADELAKSVNEEMKKKVSQTQFSATSTYP